MADVVQVGIKLTADSADFEAGTAASERAWGRLSGALGSLSTTTADITGKLQALGLAAPESLGVLATAADGAVQGFNQAQGALTTLGTTMPRLAALAFGPVGIAIAAAAAVGMAAWAVFKDDTIAAFGEVGGEAVTLSEGVSAALDVAKDLGREAMKAIGGFASDAFDDVKAWFDKMPESTSGALAYVLEGASGIFTAIGNAAGVLFEAMVGVAGAGVQGMIAALPALLTAFTGMFTQIANVGSAAWEALASGSMTPLLNQIKTSGAAVVDGFGKVAKAGSDAFKEGLDAVPAFQKLKQGASDAAEYVTKKWRDAVVNNRDKAVAEGAAGLATMKTQAKQGADELIKQQQALQDALTKLARTEITARRSLENDDLDRALKDLQDSFKLRHLSEVEYINQSADLMKQKAINTVAALKDEEREVSLAIERLKAQYVALSNAGNDKAALQTQTAIATQMGVQTTLLAAIEKATRDVAAVDKTRAVDLEAAEQKQITNQNTLNADLVTYKTNITNAHLERQFDITQIGKTTAEQQLLKAKHEATLEVQKLETAEHALELVAMQAKAAGNVIAEGDANKKLVTLREEIQVARNNIDTVEADTRDKINAESAAKLKSGLVDALYNGLMSGKGVANSLRDYFKQVLGNGLKSILTEAMNGLFGSGGIGNALGSLLGGSGGAGGGILSSLFGGSGSGGGGVGNLLGGFGAGIQNTIINGLGSVFGSAGTAFGAGLTSPLATVASGLTGFAEGGLSTAIEFMGGFAGALGAAIPIVGGVVAVLSALGVFDRKPGFKIDNSVVGVGNPASHFTQGALGAFDISTPGDQSPYNPLRKAIQDVDAEVASLLGPETLAQVRANIQKLPNATKWENLDAAGIETATKAFLKQRDGAAFDAIDPAVAAQIRAFSGTADQLLAFVKAAVAAERAVKGLNEAVPGINLTASALLGATDEQRNALATLAATFKLTTGDYVQAAKDALAASKLTLSENLSAQNTKVAGLAAALDGSLASAQALAVAEQTRLQMVGALIQQIGQISAEVSGMFTQSAEQFRLATFSDPQKYDYFNSKAAESLELLKTATDPTRIRELAAQYNSYLNSAFGLFTPEQKAANGNAFGTKADDANAIAQRQLDAAQKVAETEARALSSNIEGSIKTAMQTVATAMQAAANTMQAAANTTTKVEVRGSIRVEIDSPTADPVAVEVGVAGVA